MLKKILTVSATLVLLSSCGEQSEKPEPLKRGDKNLSCSDVQLEINEADQYKKMAVDKKRLGIKSIVMPLGYIDTFMSADEAIDAADARVQYLNRIYDIKHCDPAESENGGPSQSELNQNIQRAMQQQQPQQMQSMQPVGYTQPAAGQQYGQPIYAYPQGQAPRY
jgi:hypothetical protein